MFARSASTHGRSRTLLRLLVIGLSLVLAAAFGSPAAAAAVIRGTPATRRTAAR